MENTPDIILFWCCITAIFVLMITVIFTAIILIKKGKKQNADKMQLLGKISLCLGIICAIPIILVVGYIIYLHIG